MKKVLVLLLLSFAILTLCGRVIPAYAAEEGGKPEKAEPKGEKGEKGGEGEGTKEGGGSKKNSDVSGGKFAGDPVYVRMQPIVLPVILPNGIEQLVTVQIAVEVKDFDTGDEMHSNMPKVLDAINTSLYGSLGDGTIQNGKMLDVDKLKSRVTGALQKLLGAENIKDVLILNLSQRMLR